MSITIKYIPGLIAVNMKLEITNFHMLIKTIHAILLRIHFQKLN